ncbi:MAG: DUF2339 domain-containing protein, partial [bacterium]|nr:DUF2339 domain-containing protein [bacterium]
APPDPTLPAYRGARLATALKTWVTTGNLPVKVGVLVSMVGLGLLISEANRRGLITVTVEMVLIAVAAFGAVLLAVGWHFRHTRPIYGLSLLGGGIAVEYLAIYAAFAGYDVLAAPLAFVFVVAITVGAGALAVAQDSRSLAVLGIIGGFLAPVLSYTQPEDHVLVFTFYAILNTAIVAVAWFKVWPELTLLGFGFTFGVTSFWLAARHLEDDWTTTVPFVALFLAVYTAIPVLFAARRPLSARSFADGAWLIPLVLGTPIVGLVMHQILLGHTEHGTAISATGTALLYGGTAVAARKFSRQSVELVIAYAALGVVFAAIAIPLAFDAYYTSIAWTGQGLLLLWIGCRKAKWLAVAAGGALQVLAGFSMAVYLEDSLPYPAGEHPIANKFLLGTALIAAAGIVSGLLLHKARKDVEVDSIAAWLAMAWGAGWWLVAGNLEIDYRFPSAQLSASFVFAALSFWLVAFSAQKLRWLNLAAWGALILLTMAVVLAVSLSTQSYPFEHYGWAAWPLVMAANYSLLHRYSGYRPQFEQALHAGSFWVLTVLVSAEVHWRTGQAADGVWPVVSACLAALVLVGAILWGSGVLKWPLRPHRTAYLALGAGPVLGALAVAVAVLLFVSDGDPRPLRYVPVLNPLELTAIVLAAVAFKWRREVAVEGIGRLNEWVGRLWVPLLAAAGVAFATMATVRTVHHWGDVSFDTDSMFDSTALQTSLSILWTLIGLAAMVEGVRQVSRSAWMTGASFMGAVVLKLFLVDLRNQATVGRVVAFIAVGILLLIVGYFAPVPPVRPANGTQD